MEKGRELLAERRLGRKKERAVGREQITDKR
jgi:hypothetical protein